MNKKNFTVIRDADLDVGLRYKDMFGPLLYFRVLKTKDFMKRSGYKGSLKSFHKLLTRFKKQGFIGGVRENQFSEQYLYPKTKLIHRYKGERFREFSLADHSLEAIRLYWQVGQVFKYLENEKNTLRPRPYINERQYNFDFSIQVFKKKVFTVGIYAYLPPLDGEDDYFLSLLDLTKSGSVDYPIFFTHRKNQVRSFDLLKRHANSLGDLQVAWCHINERASSKEDFFNSPILTLRRDTTLKKYLTEDIFKEYKEEELTPREPEERGFWESLKEALS